MTVHSWEKGGGSSKQIVYDGGGSPESGERLKLDCDISISSLPGILDGYKAFSWKGKEQ